MDGATKEIKKRSLSSVLEFYLYKAVSFMKINEHGRRYGL